jgi:hypothetical protein
MDGEKTSKLFIMNIRRRDKSLERSDNLRNPDVPHVLAQKIAADLGPKNNFVKSPVRTQRPGFQTKISNIGEMRQLRKTRTGRVLR